MADRRQLEILKKGPEAWNEWRKQKGQLRVDLSGAELRGETLCEADLSGADLRGASLAGANLRAADLSGANLYDAQLGGADLFYADLSGADLRGAVLWGADLSYTTLASADLARAFLGRANLYGALVTQANFATAQLGVTLLADIDLREAKGLDTAEHLAASIIAIDTIYRSGGNIPDVFLRGCGVPDDFITYAKSLVGKALDFYSCFISHSTLDHVFAERLYADLQAKGLRCWYFPENAKWGEPVWGEIDRGIKVYDKLIVICSQHSLMSVPVLREIERALQREDKEGRNVLFPLAIDDHLFEQWQHPRKADVLSKVVGDFRGWDHGVKKYRLSFEKLLRALRAENVRPIQTS